MKVPCSLHPTLQCDNCLSKSQMVFHPPKQISIKKPRLLPLSPAQPEDAAVSAPLEIAASVAPGASAFVAAPFASAGPSAFGVASSLLLAADC